MLQFTCVERKKEKKIGKTSNLVKNPKYYDLGCKLSVSSAEFSVLF